MVESSLKYCVKAPDGTEHGPFSRAELVELFEQRQFDYQSRVRNPLVNQWKEPEDVPALKSIALAQKEADRKAEEDRPVQRLKRRFAASENVPKDAGAAIHTRGLFSFTPAPVHMRLLAGLTDLLLIGLWAVAVLALGSAATTAGVTPNTAFYLGFAVFVAGAEMLVAWPLGLTAQTVGQRFWGIMVIGTKGEPVFLFRAFVFALAAVPFGVLMSFMVYLNPSRRSVHDMISRLRVVRIRIDGSDCWTVPR